jgi:membrane protein
LLVLFMLAGANAVQQLYERIFELDSRGVRDLIRRLIWAGLVVGWLFLGDLVGPWGAGGRAGPVQLRGPGRVYRLLVVRDAVLTRRESRMAETISVRRRQRAVLAGHGGGLRSHLSRHGHLVRRQVRPDGHVFDLLSSILAVGVVIIPGAVTGLVWQERGLPFPAALRKMRRSRERRRHRRPERGHNPLSART